MSSLGSSDTSNPLARILDERMKNRKIVAIAAAEPGERLDRKRKYLSIAFSSGDFLLVDASTGIGVRGGRD